MSLTKSTGHTTYKPFKYPWAYDAWHTQQQIHWLPEEVPLAGDVLDWNQKLTEGEKNLLTQIFRFFTQSDVEVQSAYSSRYSLYFKPFEIQMMLAAFNNIETIHVAAYSKLLDTVGMPEVEYQAFLKYDEMKKKSDFLWEVPNTDDPEDIAYNLAVFSAFCEGLMLFSSFTILLNFPRFNKMKGMGQMIAWSIRDETLHVLSMIKLYNEYLKELGWKKGHSVYNRHVDRVKYALNTIIELEDNFIDLAFNEARDIKGTNAEEIKAYIRHIGNRRMRQLNIEPENPPYPECVEQPVPWLSQVLNSPEHANFFETRATEYTREATQGNWTDAMALFSSNKEWLIPKFELNLRTNRTGVIEDQAIDFSQIPG